MKAKSLRVFYFAIATFIIGTFASCDTTNSLNPTYDKYFVKYYGEDGDQAAVDLVVNTDGTFIILGRSSVGAPIILIKAEADGNVVWQKKFGENGNDDPKDVELTATGYVILSNHMLNSNVNIKLLTINNDGDSINSVIYGSSIIHNSKKNDIGNTVTPLLDGGFIITGTSQYDEDNKGRSTTVFHYRCNAQLKFLDINSWREYYGQGEKNAGTKVFQKNDSIFYLFGYSNHHEGRSNSPDLNQNMFYYHLTDKGEGITPVYLEQANDDIELSFVVQTPPDVLQGYLMVGSSNKNSNSQLRLTKLKEPLRFSGTDDLQFELNAFSSRQLNGVSGTPSLVSPQGYLVLSKENNLSGQAGSIILSKVNLNGGDLWSTSFGTSSQEDVPVAVSELPDGKIMILSTIYLDVQHKIALFKLNSKGEFLK